MPTVPSPYLAKMDSDIIVIMRRDILKERLKGPWQNWTENHYAEVCSPVQQKVKLKCFKETGNTDFHGYKYPEMLVS